MELHTSFDLLSEIIEHYERDGHSIRRADVASDERGSLHATLELPVSSGGDESGLAPTTATMTDDGGFEVGFHPEVTDSLPADVAAAVSVDAPSLRVTDDGGVLLVVTLVLDANADPATAVETEASTPPAADGTTDGTADPAPEETTAEETTAEETTAEAATDDGRTTASRFAAVRDETVPPYEDTEYLRRLYDDCDTFSEMSRVIEMDVAAETVRRYMIDAGIHTPSSYRTTDGTDAAAEAADSGPDPSASSSEETADATPEETTDDEATDDEATDGETTDDEAVDATAPEGSPSDGPTGVDGVTAGSPPDAPVPRESIPDETLVTDGIGLPEELHIDDVVDAVTESSTVYEVQRRLGLEQQRTWDLLQQLGLLELLLGRLSEGQTPAASYEAVASRIRQRTTSGA